MNGPRHMQGSRNKTRELMPGGTKKALPEVYLKGGGKIMHKIYLTDHGTQKGSTFKWMVSTMLAGVVGVGAIGTVIYASVTSDKERGAGGDIFTQISDLGTRAMTRVKPLLIDRHKGHRYGSPKTDRLVVTSKGLSTRLIIHDSYSRKRDKRDYLTIKPYARLVTTFATARPDASAQIPPFDPFKLYANTKPIGDKGGQADGVSPLSHRMVSTTSSPLPLSFNEGLENFTLGAGAAARLVAIAAQDIFAAPAKAAILPEADMNGMSKEGRSSPKEQGNVTIIAKTYTHQQAEQEIAEQHQTTVRQGDNLNAMLRHIGAENWQAAQMIAAMKTVYPAHKIQVGQKLRYVAVPKPGDAGKTEPAEISLYSNKQHLVTVARNEAGDYVASDKPGQLRAFGRKRSYPRRATLYQSMYHSGLTQKLPPETIMKLLRIHAFDTDFKRRTQPGDSFEAFFDTQQTKGGFENVPNELLYTAVTINGEARAFYRFRTPDGRIDYYDRSGNSAKKFLMRKPVRGNRVRLASGFGWRIHPILKKRKMHTGTDWAGPTGTPILAAGNGIVEKAGRKGSYGNYVRIRHANGYKTAYAHMNRIAEGVKKGVKVRQGQVIGSIGTTGRSTGPHLHFEVLVNNKFVNAMTIPVPRGLKLKGHQLAQFTKERDRINELRSRDPVTTRVASAK